LVLPVAARIGVCDGHGADALGALEAELVCYPQPHRSTPLWSERLVQEIECQDGLWVQCARHIDACRIAVEAFEGDIAGLEIGTDPLKEGVQRHAAPLADLAPTLDTDMPRYLCLQRERAQPVDRPGRLVVDEARHFEPP